MQKIYNHLIVEKGKNQKWVENKYFSTHNLAKVPFTVILPPPNVTGKLHIGHAWNGFIQDTMIRYKKLKGFDVLWIPAMDHAGISTQAKVVQRLQDENISLQDISREKFLGYAWSWKNEYSEIIREQWAKLGLALDYSSERFTLDQDANEAVNKVFIELYHDGLIYKDTKAINWDPVQKTALSNMEVIAKPTEQKMFHIKYYFKNSNQFLIVSTTRIETLFSDVAIAVHPNDTRYTHLIGKEIQHPINGKIIKLITDHYIDMEFGTGAMKVSAHATNDIDIIKKNGLEVCETIDRDGKMNEFAGKFVGLDRFVAREAIYKELDAKGLIDKVEIVNSNVGYSERSGAAVEILVSPQWFVKMTSLAQKVLDNLKSNKGVNFYPERFVKVMEKWMTEIHDWTISRQLMWGHQIPAWYKDEEIKVQVESPGEGWAQDEDVLDTWFSSALSPFVFLGWPQNNKKIQHYYPTSLLVTGWDIIFFWVARMYFSSLYFMNGQIPFNDLLLHGLIRDEQGRKMSKSLGNGIDPMEIIEKYGSDALRIFLLSNSSPGQDIRFSTQKIEAAWNINNKLWNISRYIEMMEDTNKQESDIDYWIYFKLSELNSNIDKHLLKYEFTLVGKDVQKFIYEDFSSWYIELSKSNANKKAAKLALKYLLIIIHPFMPFLTDHIYKLIFNEELLEVKQLPELKINSEVIYVDDIIEITIALRKFREEHQISKKEKIFYYLKGNEILPLMEKTISNLVNGEVVQNKDSFIKLRNYDLYIKLSDEVKANELERIQKEIEFLKNEITRAQKMLSNKGFVAKAPAEKILAEQTKLKEYENKLNNYLKEQK